MQFETLQSLRHVALALSESFCGLHLSGATRILTRCSVVFIHQTWVKKFAAFDSVSNVWSLPAQVTHEERLKFVGCILPGATNGVARSA